MKTFLELAKIALVQVPGSVEDERIMSAMSYIKNRQRNRLGEESLNNCVRVFSQDAFTLESFPYPAAFKLWKEGAEIRGRYAIQREL